MGGEGIHQRLVIGEDVNWRPFTKYLKCLIARYTARSSRSKELYLVSADAAFAAIKEALVDATLQGRCAHMYKDRCL